MGKIVYDDGEIVIDEISLYFYGTNLSYDNIEIVHLIPEPRRGLFVGFKEWFLGLIIMLFVCDFWSELTLLGDVYCLSFIVLLCFNIYMFFQKYYRLIVRTTSGLEHSTKGKNYILLNKR